MPWKATISLAAHTNRRPTEKTAGLAKRRAGNASAYRCERHLIAVPRHGWYLPGKRALEFVGALSLLALTWPLMLITALLVRLTSRGPAIYSQTRVGRRARLFTIYKFRTMIHNCESLTGPRWAILGDPRITPV